MMQPNHMPDGKKCQPSCGAGYILATASKSFYAQKDWSKITSRNITQWERDEIMLLAFEPERTLTLL